MGASFPHPEKLINTKMVMNALNPWELHDFLYPHFAIPDPLTCIISYSLSGDIPEGISVDGAGNIKGKVKHFGEQPSCQDNYSDKDPGFDGKEWENNGRFRKIYFDFHFSIEVKWVEKKDTPNGPIPCVIPGSTKQNCTIRVVKDHNIDNLIFMQKYLNGKADGPGDTKRTIIVDGSVIDSSGNAKNKSPGPYQEI